MESKYCHACETEKDVEEFALRNKKLGTRTDRCRQCMREYTRQHYLNNLEVYKAKTAEQRKVFKETIRKLKEKPCTDCGVEYPYWVMQFDHVKGTKLGTVQRMGSLRIALEEIQKCEVVCANCHAERTHERLQWHQ